MEYAIIRSGGKQYKVSAGDVIEVDKLDTEADKSIVIDDVLLFVSDGKIKVGKPNVSGISVKAKVLEQKKGDKLRVAKYKAKVRYRKVIGFRSRLTVLQIEGINSGEKAVKEKSPAKTAKKSTKK